MDEKILFVDDEELILSCFSRMLRRHFTVCTALGAAAATDAIRNDGPFAVVVCDLRMPGASGVEILELARRVMPRSVGILMTGNAYLYDAENAGFQGLVHRVLQKPCPRDELIPILQEALAIYRQSAAPR